MTKHTNTTTAPSTTHTGLKVQSAIKAGKLWHPHDF